MTDAQRSLLRGLADACRDDPAFSAQLGERLFAYRGQDLALHWSLSALAEEQLGPATTGAKADILDGEAPPLEFPESGTYSPFADLMPEDEDDPLEIALPSSAVLAALMAIFQGQPVDGRMSRPARTFVVWSLELLGRRLACSEVRT